jgi:hypothetical protein
VNGEFIQNIVKCPKCDLHHVRGIKYCRECGTALDSNGIAKEKHAKSERTAKLALGKALPIAQEVFKNAKTLRIRFTRGYSRTALDYDNLVGGLKPLRDEIARTLGIDDAESGGVKWEYAQEKGKMNKVEIFGE